ncbi:MAG: endo alpha-1,4 polygalactosaminidase [Gammaproteobacteria bacterium]|nr:endo alpha-1,4 polygalactosaminidase [Gammaproteobacteria bacterium]MCW5583753.1 endo alpha-1,4 polygalactosaminidase [Gammaproteobacteria bacterium]
MADRCQYINKLVHYCSQHVIFIVLCSLMVALFAPPANAISKVAFYYGQRPPIADLRWFDVVVVDPNSKFDPKSYNTDESSAFAYLSLGEIPKEKISTIPKSWVIGKNAIWQSSIIDASNPDWQKYVVEDLAAKLWQEGYRGFFLDTLDSYQLAAKNSTAVQRQIEGLVTIIKAIKQAYPDAKLILNRGFELLPQVHDLVTAVAVESLFASWDKKHNRYVSVPEATRNQLLNQLNQVKQWNIPVIAIEYLPATEKNQAKNLIDKINQLGFTPWITNGNLTSLELMLPSSIPRKILIIAGSNTPNYVFGYDALSYLAMPLQYLGYVPIFHDITKPLPNISQRDYAGIAVWLNRDYPELQTKFYAWLMTNKNKQIPIVFFNRFGFALNNHNLAPFGLTIKSNVPNTHGIKIRYQGPGIGFEAMPTPRSEDFVSIRMIHGKTLLQLGDLVNNTGDMIGITPWGGYALSPFVIFAITQNETRWVINPFEFLQQVLRLPVMPVPDTTTENGKRIMFVHIDGDGIANKGEWLRGPYAGKVLLDEVFNRYKIPTSISVIQGEVAANGIFPKDSEALEAIVKEIFRLPWVEIASHTFSHPYNWQPKKIDPEVPSNAQSEDFNLNIPHYQFNLADEIIGSVNYINHTLAPPDKKCKALFWSGDANPPEQALAMTYQLGIKNINGGDTDISNYNNSITQVGPLGVYQGPYFQTFAAIQNDYIYTNEWTAPFYGYINVIDAFKLTESPRRLKPINMYYHMYSGSKLAALDALKKVYDWSLAQPVINFFATEYIDKVQDFNHLAIARQGKGWLIRTGGKLRELRIAQREGYPDLVNSKNVIGYNTHGDDYYIHLGPAAESYVQLAATPSSIPYLISANAVVKQFQRNEQELNVSLTGYLPLKLSMGNMDHCWMEHEGKMLTPSSVQNNQYNYDMPGETQYAFTVKCK